MIPHDVLRWHCHPDPILRNSGDGINRHQPAVAVLVQDLCARIGHPLHDSDLPRWAMVHDEPEREMGDWPAPLALLPEFARLKRVFEVDYRRRHEIAEPDMTVTEWHVFDLCDKAEARVWAAKCRADLTQYAWPKYDVRLQKMAAKLGPDAVDWLEGIADAMAAQWGA